MIKNKTIFFLISLLINQNLNACQNFIDVPGSPFNANNSNLIGSYSPDSKFYAVTSNSADSIFVFSVDQSSGALTPVPNSPFFLGSGTAPGFLVYSSNGNYVAVSNSGTNNVSVFNVDKNTGTLTQVPGSPFSTGTNSSPAGIAYSPNNNFVAVANNASNNIVIFSVGTNGSLTQITNSPFSFINPNQPTSPNGLAYSNNGNFLAVTNFTILPGGNSVSIFSVANDGSISPISGSPFSTPTNESPNLLTFSPDDKFLAVTLFGDTFFMNSAISIYSVSTDGTLTQIPNSPFFTPGRGIGQFAYSPSGLCGAVSTGTNNSVIIYNIESNGALSQFNTISNIFSGPSANTAGLTYSPNGNFVAVSNGGTSGGESIFVFAVNTTTSVTITSPTDNEIIDNSKPTFSGTMETGNQIVTVSIDGGTKQAVTVNSANGTWTFTPSIALSSGKHTVQAFTTNTAGANDSSAVVNFTINTTEVSILVPTEGEVFNFNKPTFKGNMEIGNKIVTVSIDNDSVKNAIVNSVNGTWLFTPAISLSPGNHTIQAFTVSPLGATASTPIIDFIITAEICINPIDNLTKTIRVKYLEN